MSALSFIRNANASSRPKYTPVAVFRGGTSGIGRAEAKVLGRHTEGKADMVIVGRNKEAADDFSFKMPSPTDKKYKREFVCCDVTRMKNVEAAIKELLARYSKVNFFILSPEVFTTRGRNETEEVTRWKFIKDLLPALAKASEEGEDAKVFSILAPGKAALQARTYNDLMMEAFYDSNPAVTFIHGNPGAVLTCLLENSETTLVKLASPLANVLLWPLLTSPEDWRVHVACNIQ